MDESNKNCSEKTKFVQIVKKKYSGFSIQEANLIVDRNSKRNNDSLKGMKTSIFAKLMKKVVDEYLKQKEEETSRNLHKLRNN